MGLNFIAAENTQMKLYGRIQKANCIRYFTHQEVLLISKKLDKCNPKTVFHSSEPLVPKCAGKRSTSCDKQSTRYVTFIFVDSFSELRAHTCRSVSTGDRTLEKHLTISPGLHSAGIIICLRRMTTLFCQKVLGPFLSLTYARFRF